MKRTSLLLCLAVGLPSMLLAAPVRYAFTNLTDKAITFKGEEQKYRPGSTPHMCFADYTIPIELVVPANGKAYYNPPKGPEGCEEASNIYNWSATDSDGRSVVSGGPTAKCAMERLPESAGVFFKYSTVTPDNIWCSNDPFKHSTK